MPRPVYWRQRYPGRGARHRAYIRQELRREAAVKAAGIARPSLLDRLRGLLQR